MPTPEFALLEGPALDQVLEATRLAFAPKRSPAAHRDYVMEQRATPWGSARWRVPGLRAADGAVVASLSLYDLRLRLDQRSLRIAGVGGVVVREELRRQGLGRQLMEETHAFCAAEGFDGMLLFSAIGPEYYERLGYRSIPYPRLVADLVAVEPPAPSTSLIRPFEDADLPAVRELHARDAALRRFALLRDAATWEINLLGRALSERLFGPPAQPEPASFVVGERDGAVVSYFRFGRREGELVLLELGFEPEAREDLAAAVHWQLERIEQLGGEHPGELTGLVPSRVANLVPTRSVRFVPDTRLRMMMKDLGASSGPGGLAKPEVSLDAILELEPDERIFWASDAF